MTAEGPVNSVKLQGATGYLFGANELHRLCEKLYSNTSKGLVAKSMTIEDLNKATEHTVPINNMRYAWYPADIPDVELRHVEAGGKVYTAKRHTADLATGVSKPRFYTWDDENGVTHTAKDENDYKELKNANEPILTSRTWYGYNPDENIPIINDILRGTENDRGWQASQYLTLREEYEYAGFEMRNVYTNIMSGSGLYYSTGKQLTATYGLRPVISFNINRLDISDTTKTGTETASWNIK